MATGKTARRRREPQIGIEATGEPLMVLKLPRSAGLRVSQAMFERLCAENDFLRLERTAEGRLIVMAPAGAESGRKNADLITDLNIWARADGRGRVFDSSAGFILPNGATVGPDAAWVLRERWDSVPADRQQKFPAIAPDFVIELRSPSDRLNKLRKKMGQYIEQGVRLAWLIDPIGKRAEVHRPGREPESLDKPNSLNGEEVLPGFVLDLRNFWND